MPNVMSTTPLFAGRVLRALEDQPDARVGALVRARHAADLDPFRDRFPVQQTRTVPGVGRCALFGERMVTDFTRDESLADFLVRVGFEPPEALALQTDVMKGATLFFLPSNARPPAVASARVYAAPN
jgi:hypothetical protein